MKYINSLFAVGIVACLASCSKEETQPKAVALNANIGQVETDTKSGIADVSSLSGKEIVMLALNKEVSETEYGTTGRKGNYTIDASGSATAVTGKEIWLLKQRATIYAAFPSKEIEMVSGIPNISVSPTPVALTPTILSSATRSDLDFASANNDYMYGVTYNGNENPFVWTATQPFADNGKTGQPESLNQYGSNISIGFRHALAQIVLVVKSGDYFGEGKVEKVVYSRSLHTISATTKMSMTDGRLTNLTPLAPLSYSYDLSSLSTPLVLTKEAVSNVVLTNYAFPLPSTSDAKIEVTIDEKNMEVSVPNDAQWQAGNIYVYHVSVNKSSLALDAVSVVAWNEEELGNVTIN